MRQGTSESLNHMVEKMPEIAHGLTRHLPCELLGLQLPQDKSEEWAGKHRISL